MAKFTTTNINGVNVQTSNTAASRNRLGLPNQKDIAEMQLQAKLADEANKINLQMNEENNKLQMDLANLSYERSTALNQYRELIKAGYTEQQAKLALLGNLSPATQPVADTNAGHVDFPQLAAPTSSDNSLANSALSGGLGMAGDLFGILGNSLISDDGGPIGWALASDYMSELTSLVDKGYITPDDMCLPADLVALGRSMEDGEAKDAVLQVAHGKNAYRVATNPLGMRGAQKWLLGNFGFKTSLAQVQNTLQDKRLKYAQEQLANNKITTEVLEQAFKSVNTSYVEMQTKVAESMSKLVSSQKAGQDLSNNLLKYQEEFTRLTQPSMIEETISKAQLDLDVYMTELSNRRLNKSQIEQLFRQNLDLQAAALYCYTIKSDYEAFISSGQLDQITSKDGDIKGIYKFLGALNSVGLDVGKMFGDVLSVGAKLGGAAIMAP